HWQSLPPAVVAEVNKQLPHILLHPGLEALPKEQQEAYVFEAKLRYAQFLYKRESAAKALPELRNQLAQRRAAASASGTTNQITPEMVELQNRIKAAEATINDATEFMAKMRRTQETLRKSAAAQHQQPQLQMQQPQAKQGPMPASLPMGQQGSVPAPAMGPAARRPAGAVG
ncbi:hypothetical protein KEM52_003544, partial [Ascosphaera acerosa]